VAIAAHPFAGGGTVRFDERLAALRPPASATLAPATAATAGLRGDELVDLKAGERVLRGLEVRIDGAALEGVVSVFDGLPAAPASVFDEGERVALDNVRAADAALVGGAA
jgi:hypothetical protein